MQIPSYEDLLDSCLANVTQNIDKREGSLIYTAIAPICAELAKFYLELSSTYDLSFVDTSHGEYLDKIANQFGIHRNKSTKSIRLATFEDKNGLPLDIDTTHKFSIQNLIYSVDKKVSTGTYHLLCTENGSAGNKYFGELSPCQHTPNLSLAVLKEVISAGADTETDESLKTRFYIKVKGIPFGGNISDYQSMLLKTEGVGAVRVYPVFNGGGTVKLSILTSEFKSPVKSFIEKIQNIVDPVGTQGTGMGFAPIGHRVTVTGGDNQNIDISTKITYMPGWNFEKIKPYLEKEIDDYFYSISKNFSNNKNLVVRISHIESRFLSLEGILDIFDTEINGSKNNIVLAQDLIPKRGALNVG